MSIAAASSYFYLKNFPIEKISKVVDYIIYMTYDLHGQVGNQTVSIKNPTHHTNKFTLYSGMH